ncbi:MAG: PHB depolymerase family esterase [Planctomycetota bacterium]|nr:PHB depolymerase family esterase [Planctomycetota bacterium]
MRFPKQMVLCLLITCSFVVAQEESKIDWEREYEKLLKSDPAVREKIESGKTTKKEIMDWLRSVSGKSYTPKKKNSPGDKQKKAGIDWNARYEKFLASDPGLRKKVEQGEATREQVIEYLKLTSGAEDKKKASKEEWEQGKRGEKNGCGNSSHKGYHAITENGEKREYLLYHPTSYDKKRRLPLVINFHGFGDCASDYEKNIGSRLGLNATAEKNGFLVAYPQAVFREKGARYWEPGDPGNKSLATNDVYFTRQLITDVSKKYKIDSKRVYAVGYSNGGMMAYDLASSKDPLIAAIGVMSGTMLGDPGGAGNVRTSVIHFHGIDDGVLPYPGNRHYRSVPETIRGWVVQNQIPLSSLVRETLNQGNVIRERYTSPRKEVAVHLYTIRREHDKPGGHVWFSDEVEGRSPNQILWDFLSRYRLDRRQPEP